eukprot:9715434-Karenia_brevis.AAC.1
MANSSNNVLERWEPDYFRKLIQSRSEFKFVKHVEAEPNDMSTIARKVCAKTAALVQPLATPPSDAELRALRLVASYIFDYRE